MPGRHQPEAREGLRVVVVGPLPEPHNGMTVVTETILSSSLRERDFTADRFADGLAAIWWDVARGGTPDGSLAAAMEAAAT
jgi:hypothetical protein